MNAAITTHTNENSDAQHLEAIADRLFLDERSTPIGQMLTIVDEAERIRALDWADYQDRMQELLTKHYQRTKRTFSLENRELPPSVAEPLDAYFEGQIDALDSLAVAPGGTAFQELVWSALRTIKPGETKSYGELARAIDRPGAARAVGLANATNPIGIVIPCHRVIGSNGSLTGYGGGLHRKRWLLAHEGVLPADISPEL